MARVLIVPCGARGEALARGLIEDGFAVRATTRRPERLAAIRQTGAEAVLADPDRIGTLMDALAGVSVLCWLAGNAQGPQDKVEALHDERLRMLFEKVVDTPVRGVVYEAAGSLDPALFARGRAVAQEASSTWALPVRILTADPREHSVWLQEARTAVGDVLSLLRDTPPGATPSRVGPD